MLRRLCALSLVLSATPALAAPATCPTRRSARTLALPSPAPARDSAITRMDLALVHAAQPGDPSLREEAYLDAAVSC
jgi:hypothetical protein